MFGFAGLEPMKSNLFAVWFVPVSGLEHFLKNMEHAISCPWHLSSSERNFSLSPALQLWHGWWFEYVWMIDPFPNLKELFEEVWVQSEIWRLKQLTSMMGYGWRCGGRTCWDFQNGWCPRGRRCRWSHQVGILDSSCGILKHSVVQFRMGRLVGFLMFSYRFGLDWFDTVFFEACTVVGAT